MNTLYFSKTVRHIYFVHGINKIKDLFIKISISLSSGTEEINSIMDGRIYDCAPFYCNSKIRRTNSLFIVTGVNDFGTHPFNYYETMLLKMNEFLAKHKSHIVFVRAGGDNPSFFDGNTVNLSNIKAIPDYTIIKAKGHNILCVGGSISLDRTYKIRQQELVDKYTHGDNKLTFYWDDEKPFFDKDKLNEIIKKGIYIDVVITNSSPSFIKKNDNLLSVWAKNDTQLLNDVSEERTVFDMIYDILSTNGIKPKYWAVQLDLLGDTSQIIDETKFKQAQGFDNLIDLEYEIKYIENEDEEISLPPLSFDEIFN